MATRDAPDPRTDSFGPADLVEAGRYDTAASAAERGLVVLATGCAYWLEPRDDGFHLLVERDVAGHVGAQLAKFERERMRWPPPPITDPWLPRKADLFTPLMWAASVLLIHQGSGRFEWRDHGALDAQAVFAHGEWWRLGTALFLHADFAHVISNALGGILVFCAVVSTMGRGRGWLLVALAAVLGNLAVAAVNYPGPYRSVGASTAIFAAVGLLTGRALRVVARSRHPHRWRAMFAPLAAGITVLALYGAGGLRVDVGAHLAGFLAGLPLGFIAGLPGSAGVSPATHPSGPEARAPRAARE
ncbi:MAG: rhomboid family intramembrane serine protease [Opitutaceae bacterium]|nr:rhomboid family intramembrane serine protease [Opitutaceae bacterium]